MPLVTATLRFARSSAMSYALPRVSNARLPYFGLLADGAALADGSSLAEGASLDDGAALADGSIDDVVTARRARSLAAVNNVV